MRNTFGFSFLVLCFIQIWAATVFSGEIDTTKNDLPIFYLGEIVVTAGKSDKPPAGISEITAKQIESQGATTAGEALSSTPGAWISTGHKNSTEIKLRGFSSEHVLILVDGRPVNLPYYGDLDLSSLPVNNISKIKVVKGPATSLYGANTMGGIVNIVTKRVNRGTSGDVQLSFGEAGTWNSALNLGAKINKLDFWLSAGKSQSDGFNLSDDFQPARWEDGGLRDNSDYDRFNLDGKLNLKWTPQTDLSLSWGYFDGDKGLPGGVNDDLPKFWRFEDWKRRYLDLSGENYFGSRWYLKAKLYYDGCKNRLVDYDSTYLYENRNFDSIHDSWDLGANLLGKLSWSKENQSAWGVNVLQNGINKRMDIDEEWENKRTVTTSLFTQHQIVPGKRISLDLGLAYNIMTSRGVKRAKTSFDPTFGFWYSVLESLRLRVSASRATKFPTLSQLYGETSGNTELKPEEAIKMEGGMEWDITPQLHAEINLFRNNVNNLIDRKGRSYQYQNLDQVVLQGVEMGWEGNLGKLFSFNLDYAYLDAYDQNSGYWLSYRPAHKLDWNLTYTSSFGLTLYSNGQYVSKRVTPHPESELLPQYYVINLKISQKLFLRFYPFVEIKNVFDKNYEEEKGFPAAGRAYFLGMKIIF